MPVRTFSGRRSFNYWKGIAVALGAYILVDKLGPPDLSTSPLASRWQHDETRRGDEAVEPVSRVLAAASGSGSSGSSGGGDDHHHPHEVLLVFVVFMCMGTFLMHLDTMPKIWALPLTVGLFLSGWLLSMLFHLGGSTNNMAGRSFTMWIGVDPHLLLYTLLPPLLAADAMAIDVNIVRLVIHQALYLAGPGVAIMTFLTATFLWLYLPYGWSFLLCISTGAILCATDPVAVVALLKELGASPTLTVQIQGESLLNDGTAIVMFNLAYAMLGGASVSVDYVITYLVKMALYAVIFGVSCGYFFIGWMWLAADRLNHHSALLQALISICCCYTSFYVAEAVFGVSGVLAVVASSATMAAEMWKYILCRESFFTIWHMLEFMGNTIIFMLAGALVGDTMAKAAWMDYIHLFVIYVFLIVSRFVFLQLSRPLLKVLHARGSPISGADATLMAWGGLRGAVGLCLAIQVNNDRAGGSIDPVDANRVLFYVGGIALLTLIINATTCPALVAYFGLARSSHSQVRILNAITDSMRFIVDAGDDSADWTGVVRDYIRKPIEEAKHHVEHMLEETDVPVMRTSHNMKIATAPELEVERFDNALREYLAMPLSSRQDLETILPHAEYFKGLCTQGRTVEDRIIKDMNIFCDDVELRDVISESFLILVRAEYWNLLESQSLSPQVGEILLNSVINALGDKNFTATTDYDYLQRDLICVRQRASLRGALRDAKAARMSRMQGVAKKATDNTVFVALIAIAIIGTSMCVAMEEFFPDMPKPVFTYLEIIFNAIFTLEYVLRTYVDGSTYVISWVGIFDLVLVLLGWSGIILYVMIATLNVGSQQAQTIKSVRVLKALRAFRVFRLLAFVKVLVLRWRGIKIDEDLRDQLLCRALLMGYSMAHLNAQEALTEYLRGTTKKTAAAAALCNLQSTTSVLEALTLVHERDLTLPGWIATEVNICRRGVALTNDLHEFVTNVQKSGVITVPEAHHILHPNDECMIMLQKRLADLRSGSVKAPHPNLTKVENTGETGATAPRDHTSASWPERASTASSWPARDSTGGETIMSQE